MQIFLVCADCIILDKYDTVRERLVELGAYIFLPNETANPIGAEDVGNLTEFI